MDDLIQRAFRDGIKTISKDELEERGPEIEKAIKKMPESMDKYRLYVELGEAYLNSNCDNGALRVFAGIISALRYSQEPESYDLWDRTCFGLAALHNSNNDYVADKAGEIYSELLAD